MSNLLIVMLTLPYVILLTGAWIMSKICNLKYVKHVVHQLPNSRDRKPLYGRLSGYDIGAVNRYWTALDETARRAQKCFLVLDLFFPLLYGAAFLTSLLMAWVLLGRPFHPLWLMAPVAVTIIADWTENLVQIAQLRSFRESGEAGLHVRWIQVASIATILKLIFFVGTTLFHLGLAAMVIHAINLD